MNTNSSAAAIARDLARQKNGEFGTQSRVDVSAEVDLVADASEFEHIDQQDRIILTRYLYRDAARNLDAYAADKANDFEDVDRADAFYKSGLALASGEAYIVTSVPGAANITPPGAMGRTQCSELIAQGDGVRPSPHWKSQAITNVHERNTEPMTWTEAQAASDHMLTLAMLNVPDEDLSTLATMDTDEYDAAWRKQGVFNNAVNHAIALREGRSDIDPERARLLADTIRASQAAAENASPDYLTDKQQVEDIWGAYDAVDAYEDELGD